MRRLENDYINHFSAGKESNIQIARSNNTDRERNLTFLFIYSKQDKPKQRLLKKELFY